MANTQTKGDWGAMTRLDEAKFNRRVEKEMQSHRGLQNGRDFRWNCFRWRDESSDFQTRFDQTFKGAPGSSEWFETKFCPVCEKRWAYCECDKEGIAQ